MTDQRKAESPDVRLHNHTTVIIVNGGVKIVLSIIKTFWTV